MREQNCRFRWVCLDYMTISTSYSWSGRIKQKNKTNKHITKVKLCTPEIYFFILLFFSPLFLICRCCCHHEVLDLCLRAKVGNNLRFFRRRSSSAVELESVEYVSSSAWGCSRDGILVSEVFLVGVTLANGERWASRHVSDWDNCGGEA